MKKNNKGYSLIEVLAAFAIISIAILPIMSMYPAIFKQNKSASEMEEASRIAFTIVDYIKARGYTNLTKESSETKKLRDTVLFNGNTGTYLTYKLTNDTGSTTFHTVEYKLDKNLGFSTNVIFLNSKGLNLGAENTVIAVSMRATEVNFSNASDKFKDPLTGLESNTVYGVVNDKFVTGRVIIGWGKTIPIETAKTDDQKIVLKEKAYGIDYIITPSLKK